MERWLHGKRRSEGVKGNVVCRGALVEVPIEGLFRGAHEGCELHVTEMPVVPAQGHQLQMFDHVL